MAQSNKGVMMAEDADEKGRFDVSEVANAIIQNRMKITCV